jgi:hypothetical protein
LKEKIPFGAGVRKYRRRHPWSWLKKQTLNLAGAVVLFGRLMPNVPEAELRRESRRRLWRLLKARRDPNLLVLYVIKCLMHYHQYTLVRQLASPAGRLVNTI